MERNMSKIILIVLRMMARGFAIKIFTGLAFYCFNAIQFHHNYFTSVFICSIDFNISDGMKRNMRR